MRVSENARKASVFLGYSAATQDEPAKIDLKGTGFLVHAGDAGVNGVYLITAAHVAKGCAVIPSQSA